MESQRAARCILNSLISALARSSSFYIQVIMGRTRRVRLKSHTTSTFVGNWQMPTQCVWLNGKKPSSDLKKKQRVNHRLVITIVNPLEIMKLQEILMPKMHYTQEFVEEPILLDTIEVVEGGF